MSSSKIVNNLDVADIGLIKFGVLFFAFWLVSASSTISNWVISTNQWVFFSIGIICMIRPLYKMYLKKEKKEVEKKTQKKKRK
jgi:hypothetical protein